MWDVRHAATGRLLRDAQDLRRTAADAVRTYGSGSADVKPLEKPESDRKNEENAENLLTNAFLRGILSLPHDVGV